MARTASRAALLVTIIECLFFLTSLNLKKQAMAAAFGGLVVFAAASVVPTLQENIYERLVLKGTVDESGAIFISRQDVWNESFEQALKGGIVGGGYGITIGDLDLENTISVSSAVNYGREKGNTQLAVWEELGAIGLGLYVWLIVALGIDLWRGLRKTKELQKRIELSLVTGAVFGFIVHSIFEAWWVAPGAPESAFFWGMIGVARGMTRRSSYYRQRPQDTGPASVASFSPVSSLANGR